MCFRTECTHEGPLSCSGLALPWQHLLVITAVQSSTRLRSEKHFFQDQRGNGSTHKKVVLCLHRRTDSSLRAVKQEKMCPHAFWSFFTPLKQGCLAGIIILSYLRKGNLAELEVKQKKKLLIYFKYLQSSCACQSWHKSFSN